MALSCNYYELIVQRLEKIYALKAAPKVPKWLSYGNFCKVTQNPHFLKKCISGTKGNFSKMAQKVALVIAILARSPKTRILLKSAKGGPREIF